MAMYFLVLIRVITKLPNSEQSYKGKVQTHNYINRQNQSTTGKLLKCESEIKLLWVKIQNKGIPDLYIGSFYKPPNMTDESIIQELDKSIYRVKQSPNSHIWLGDDFNLGGINWENGSIRPNASSCIIDSSVMFGGL
jgi:hypothetical protein